MAREEGIYAVYLSLRSSLMRAVMRIVPPREVEDIVQETYVRVCQIETRGRDIEEPRAFLFKTARNLALDHLKRAETRLVVNIEEMCESALDELGDVTDRTFDLVASDEEFSLFCKAVRELPVQCRKIFVLKKVYGYSQQEIARHFNLSENTVEKHIAQGIRRCTYFMQQYDKNYEKRGKQDKRTNQVRRAERDS